MVERRMLVCRTCRGTGAVVFVECDLCGGTGVRRACQSTECIEHGCSGYGYCYVPKLEAELFLAKEPRP